MTLGIILLLLGGFLIGGVVSMAGQARDAARVTDTARRARYGAPRRRGPLVAAVVLGVCAALALAAGVLRVIA